MSDDVRTGAASAGTAGGAHRRQDALEPVDPGRCRQLPADAGGQAPGPASGHGPRQEKAVENFRSTSIIRPDGTREKIVIDSPAERMKTYYFGVKIALVLLGILFAPSILHWAGQQAAGHAAPFAEGFMGATWKRIKPW